MHDAHRRGEGGPWPAAAWTCARCRSGPAGCPPSTRPTARSWSPASTTSHPRWSEVARRLPAQRDRLPAAERGAVVRRPRLGRHPSSVIQLVNPNAGRAVGDVVLWSQTGPLGVPELLGISVPGGEGVEIDLAEVTPRRGELMAQVTARRGRLAVDVADSVDELGTGLVATDWLTPQAAPTTRHVLLGVARGSGDRNIVSGTRATTRCGCPSGSSPLVPCSPRPASSRSRSPAAPRFRRRWPRCLRASRQPDRDVGGASAQESRPGGRRQPAAARRRGPTPRWRRARPLGSSRSRRRPARAPSMCSRRWR